MDMASIDDLQEEKKKKGAKGVTARWQRRMKLTPCVVMTCYMLPGNMQISEHKVRCTGNSGHYHLFFF
ncbi:hypothetical protein SDY_4486 [Shigella dysenteriae Sd197]|uniref:Uncharacterized protein n=2 Tax=Shigella dysenteriae TaxID=622 RepID=Q327Z3_SHIDS|nr:hypothetical protein SDY_4486 [Shigella dysenteriae Sd197]SPZ68439.1 putative superfamily I DNA helicase [Shigella dysenteriae]